jgi:hypothetical protein
MQTAQKMLTTQEVRVDYFILSEKKTGAFFNNSWRISPGGQWRVAAATGAPPQTSAVWDEGCRN